MRRTLTGATIVGFVLLFVFAVSIAHADDSFYYPTQILAVIVYKAGFQITCIEVMNINGVIPEYPVGPVVASASFVLTLGLFKYRDNLPAVSRFKRH